MYCLLNKKALKNLVQGLRYKKPFGYRVIHQDTVKCYVQDNKCFVCSKINVLENKRSKAYHKVCKELKYTFVIIFY